jgi:hypothetical protein
MASKKISELSSSLAPPLSGVTAVVHGGTTYKSTLTTLRQVLVDSGSHSFTGSQFIGGNLTVSGSVTAQQFILSSSIANIVTETISGSSNFGNSLDDRHIFTGSVRITGSLNTIGDLTITGKIPSLIVGTGSFHVDNPEILHVENSGSYNITHFQANNEYYAQVNITNTNSGSFASTDLVLTADNGTEVVHYANFGINSSTYNGGAVGLANDSYLMNAGKDLYIGTLGGSQHPAEVKLFTMNNWFDPQITLHAVENGVSFNTSSIADGYTYEFSGSLNLLHNININGITNLGSTSEKIIPLNNPTTGYTHNFNSGSILYVTGATSNITVNVINVPISNNKGIGLTVMIEQSSTAYMVDSIKINSDNEGSVAIMWYGGSLPSGNANSYDIVSFSILKVNGLWKVFGQMTTFGESDTPPTSPTPTRTVTPTSTITPTPTPSLTPTDSQTPTMSPTPSETSALAPSATPTMSMTPTITTTPTATVTSTPTLSMTPSGTPTMSPTMTPSGTPGATPSETPSMTPSETPTMTPTMTPSETPTMTPSETPTMTPSETPTMTPSETPTMTPSETPGATPTVTPSETPTMTPSETPTMTPSETPTMTPSETPTMTPSETPTMTPTMTMTPSETPTMTPSETPTMTPSETPTMTPSETPTMTPSETPTMTPSETPTMTPSETPTMTMTPSETPTMTPSETPTMTMTPSETPTMTPTMTMTPSETPTITPTMSITPSETPTMTPTMTMTPSPTSPPITLGDWFLNGDEGLYSGQTGTTLNVGGNMFFTNGPSSNPSAFTVSFNPNFIDSNTVIRFSTKNSADVEYFTLFENFRVNGGTMSLTQNGNTARYTLNPGLMVISDQGSYTFFVFNASASVTQIQQSPVSFVKNVPITVTLRG